MYQPLEQFVAWKIFFLYGLVPMNYIHSFFLDKYVIIVIVSLLIVTMYTYFFSQKPTRIFIQLYNWLQTEFVNVTGNSLNFFLPVFVCLFIYIYFFNLLGLLPYTACWTTQFFANLTLSFSLIFGITLLNIDKNGLKFLELFIPSGVPSVLKPLLFVLEFLSYWIRILSLSIRLFSNMVAGHSLLHILFDMSLNVKSVLEYTLDLFIFISLAALLIIYVIVIFEFIVAFLQAYVFSVMFSIYINDLKLSH